MSLSRPVMRGTCPLRSNKTWKLLPHTTCCATTVCGLSFLARIANCWLWRRLARTQMRRHSSSNGSSRVCASTPPTCGMASRDGANMNAQRHPKNAPGDFYVILGYCVACEAPEHEAPDLMSHI